MADFDHHDCLRSVIALAMLSFWSSIHIATPRYICCIDSDENSGPTSFGLTLWVDAEDHWGNSRLVRTLIEIEKRRTDHVRVEL